LYKTGGTLAQGGRHRQGTWKYRPLVKRTYRVCARVVLGVTLVLATLLVVAALRLMAGPVDLNFLKGRLIAAADVPGNDIKPDVDRISLEWGGLARPMRLVFTGLRFLNADNQVIATAPVVALTFDPRSVFQGMLLPTSITMEKPTIEAKIDREGGMLRRVLADTTSQSQGEAVGILIEQLLAEPNYKSLIGQLDTIRIEQAKVTLRDIRTGLTWVAPSARAQLKRDTAGVIISASARFHGNGEPFDVWLDGVYSRDRSRISVEANVDGLRPSIFADLSPDAVLLRGIDIALAGRVRIEAGGQGDVRSVAIEVTGGNGRVTLPGVLPAAHPVKSVSARAIVDAVTHTAKVERVALDFGAAKVAIAGSGMRTPDGQTFAGRVDITHIPVDRLADYWPLEFAVGGRQWALVNLSKGEIDVAAEFALSAPGNDMAQLKVDRMIGLIGYRGMTVRYMPHMPELQGVSGKARYEGGTLHFDVAGGAAVGLTVKDATIDLTGLAGPRPHYAAIRMPIAGRAPDVIRFLARPKLGLSREILYDYRRVGGETTIDLALSFPLLNALTVAELDIKADATVTHFSLQDALGDVDLSDATARLKYAGSELHVSGTGKLDGNMVEIGWRELFGAKVPFRRRYDMKGTVPASLIAKAGLPSPEPYVTGPLGTTVSYQVATNGTGEVVGRFDLKGATIDARPLDWKKEPGAEAQALLTLKLAAGGKLSTIDFDGRGNGLVGKGQARFAGDNALQQISLTQLKVGRTDLAVDWRRGPTGVDVSLRGPLLELPRVRHALKTRDEIAVKDPSGAAGAGRARTRLNLQLQQATTERGTLGYVNGWLELAGERIAAGDLGIGGGKGSTLRVTPDGTGRKLSLYVADFGALLHEAGWLDGMVSGYLQIEGQYNDAVADSPFAGLLKMGPYRLRKVAPRWGVGSLNSTIEGLSRAGNALQQFDGLQADVSKTGDRVHIKNGRTNGQSIGLTTQGFVDLGNDTARLGGIVVPAFAFNNLLSDVPLLGPLLTGGKDGGVFAIAYQLYGPLDNLKTNINMMSAMTPGALRDLLNSPPAPSWQPPPSQEMQRAP
jgi:hypothetical protein